MTPINRHISIILITLFALINFGCSIGSTPSPAVIIKTNLPALPPSPTIIASNTPEPPQNLHSSPPPAPTQTLTQISTDTPTETPTPQSVQALIIVSSAKIRTGPGEVYPILITYNTGLVLNVLGRNSDSTWLHVDLTLGQTGWIAKNVVEISGQISSLQKIEAPPTPTTIPLFPKVIAYITSGGVLIAEVSNFNPDEKITVQLIYAATRAVFNTRTFRTDANGNKYLHLLEKISLNLKSQNFTGGIYTITIQGESGTFVQTQIFLDTSD